MALTARAPKVIGGTKCPSMTSTWMTRAPAASTAPTCSPSRAKSAARIDGATWRPVRLRGIRLDRSEHAALAVVAGDDRRARHADDGGMLAAVRAHRHELVPLQAVHAAIATRDGGGPQPRLAASRTGRPELHGR